MVGSIASGSYNRDKRMGWESSSASSFQMSSNGTDNSGQIHHSIMEVTYDEDDEDVGDYYNIIMINIIIKTRTSNPTSSISSSSSF